MPLALHAEPRVLGEDDVRTLADYEHHGGGRGVRAARQVDPRTVVDEIDASGLRGRGGAGFPTGVKWRTVAGNASSAIPATVVVNGSEGEPGTFKDRAIMRTNPYAVIEGALVAAYAVGADRAVIALKDSFGVERRALESAIAACSAAGWCDGVRVGVATGPSEYLFGEETGLLEVLDGRPPFPRIAPPFRHGVDEVGRDPDEPAGTTMATPVHIGAPPTLVNNVETIANVPRIIADGADWFRSVGTEQSPGTVVCTVTGATAQHGFAEIALGTPLAKALQVIGGGTQRRRRHFVAAMSGVANALVTADQFETPLTYEDMRAAGSGLGSAGFIVFDDQTDFVSVAAGVARFLAVESCGQCTPCKQDGLAIASLLEALCRSEAPERCLEELRDRIGTVADSARCNLAIQQETVIGSIFRLFPDAFEQHAAGRADPVEPMLVAPIVDMEAGTAVLDGSHAGKQPDWTYGDRWSGKTPVERLAAGGDAPQRVP